MKTKTLLPALLLLCLCRFAQAQTPDSVLYRHHIGVNTRVVLDKVIDQESLTPLQLLYKYQLTPRSALRLSVEGMYSTSDSSQSLTSRKDKITDYLYRVSIGFEQQKSLSKIFTLYYGTDMFYQRTVKSIETHNSYIEPYPSLDQMEISINDKFKRESVGVNPFLGLRINVGQRFYLSAESALSLKREQKNWNYNDYVKRKSTEGNYSIQPGYTDYKVKRTLITYLPFSGINLQYIL